MEVSLPEDFPLSPPRMDLKSDIWHPFFAAGPVGPIGPEFFLEAGVWRSTVDLIEVVTVIAFALSYPTTVVPPALIERRRQSVREILLKKAKIGGRCRPDGRVCVRVCARIEPWMFGLEVRAGPGDTVAMLKAELYFRGAFPPDWLDWVDRTGTLADVELVAPCLGGPPKPKPNRAGPLSDRILMKDIADYSTPDSPLVIVGFAPAPVRSEVNNFEK